MSKKIWQGVFSVFLLLGLALSLGAPDKALASSAEIDTQLLAALEESGQANFVVMMGEKADLSAAYEIEDWNERGWYVYNTLLELSLRSQTPVIEYAKLHDLEFRAYVATNAVYIKMGNLEAVQDLASLPGVAAIELERIEQIEPELSWVWSMPLEQTVVALRPEAYGWNLDVLDPNSSLYGMQAAQVWSTYGVDGEGIVVGNIDTGGMYDHNALVNQYRGNLGGGTFDHNYNWWDPINNNPVAYDDHGHGSGTIGIMSGETANLIEQIGVAPGTKWIACKGCNSAGGCPTADLLECFDFHLAPWDLTYTGPGTGNPDPTKRAHIVNNSWGGSGCSTTYQAGIQAWVAAGMFPAFSAGNTVGCGTVGSPGDNPEAFGTAAHDTPGLNIYAGGPSCFYPTPTCDPNAHDVDPHLNAPTYGRTADNCQDCYYNLGGTSGASPHTAGTVALIWSGNPGLIGDIPGTFYILEQSTNHDYFPEATCGKPACAGADTWPNYDYGWGYLDALAAVTMAGVGGQGWLDGTITEAGPVDAPGDPLAGITVLAERQGGGSKDTTTDVTGYYSMTLTSGTYTVTASGPQHTAQTLTGVVIVTGTLHTENFQLDPKGLLYGYVTDADNGFGLDAMVMADDGTITYTNPATGYYEMYLDAGSYVITATVTDYAPGTASVVIVSGGMLQQDFPLLRAVSFVPTPLHVTVDWQSTYNTVATLNNNNPWSYDFEFMEIPGGYTPGIEAAWPGPDGYGYVGEVVDFDWVDIAATGTPVLLSDDNYGGPFPVGFDFPLYANVWQDFYIASNGYVAFGAGSSTLTNQCPLPSATTPNNIIPVMWDDLDPGDTGDIVYYESFGACPVGGGSCLVVQYEDFCHYPGGATCNIAGTFEAILFDNGSVLIQFEDAGVEEGSGSTTGIENNNAPADYGLTYACNTAASIYDGLAMCLVYPGSSGCLGADVPWFGQDPTSGTVPAMDWINPTMYFTATYAAGVDQPGDYYATLLVKGNPSVRVPVTMTVLPSANLGLLEGTVTSNRPGGPLEADILIDNGMGMTWTLVTDPATGYYSFWLEQGSYDVTASAAGYVAQTAGVVINPAATTTQDFELQLDAPWIDVMPTSMQATVEMGTWTTDTLTIYNDGLQTLEFDIGEVDNGYDPAMCVDALCEEIYGSTASQWGPGGTRDRGNIFEATEDTVISEIRVWLNFSAPTDMYFIVYEGTGVTGSYTKIFEYQVFNVGTGAQWHSSGPINVLAEAGKFYYVGASWNGAALYWRGTEPVPITTNCFGILRTGVPGTLAGYPPAPTMNNTYTNFSPYHFAVVTGGGDVPWLSEDPITGTVPAGNWLDVEVTFDATVVAEPGDYYAELRIGHNDPLNDDVTVPVTMTVQPTADTAKLQGWVNGLGYCDADYYPLEEAEVYIEASSGMTWTRLTDADGYYYLWLNAPANSPLTLTVTYPEHDIGFAAGVELTGGMTTTVDFDLRWLMPCVSTDPDAFEVTVALGYSLTYVLEVNNAGAADSGFGFSEMDHGYTPTLLMSEPFPNVPQTDADVAPSSRSPIVPFAVGDILAMIDVQAITGDNQILGVEFVDGHYWVTGGNLGADPNKLYKIDAAGTLVATYDQPGHTAGWGWRDMVWDGQYLYASGSATVDQIDPATGQWTGVTIPSPIGNPARALAYNPATDTFFTASWSTAINEFDRNGSVVKTCPSGLAGVYGMAWDQYSGYLWIWSQDPGVLATQFDWNTCTATGVGFIGYNDPLDIAGGAAITDELFPGQLVFIGAHQGDPSDLLVVYDLDVTISMDIPWLFEDPVTGTVGADSSFFVDLIFDASVVTQTGTYSGTLILSSDDPVTDTLEIPVTMHVVEPAYGVDLSEDMAKEGLPSEVVVYTLTVTNLSNGPMDTFSVALGSSVFPSSADVSEVGPLAPYGTAEFHVMVTIPGMALPGEFDMVEVTVTSQGDPTQTDMATLTTSVGGSYGVDLEPEASAASGEVGTMVTYTLRLSNTGELADTLVLTYTDVDTDWVVQLPEMSFDLAGGAGVDVIVRVIIPAGAADGDFDAFTLTTTSAHDPAQSDSVEITTTAVVPVPPGSTIYLPFIARN